MLLMGAQSISRSTNRIGRCFGDSSVTMRTVFSRIRSGTAWSTRPMRFARRASIALPVSRRSNALAGPTSFGSHCTPCHAGMIPSITSGSANRVLGSSSATR
jgi:hypothetical protein